MRALNVEEVNFVSGSAAPAVYVWSCVSGGTGAVVNGYGANILNGNSSMTAGPVIATFAAGCISGTFGTASLVTQSLYRVTFGTVAAFYGFLANAFPGSILNSTPPPPSPTSTPQAGYDASIDSTDWQYPSIEALEAQLASDLAGLLDGQPGPTEGQITRFVD